MILEATAAILLQQPLVIRPDPDIRAQRTASVRSVWDRLAECESGEWIDGGRAFVEGSARWDASEGLYEGGIQFHPGTWDRYRPNEYPSAAFQATRNQQIVVGKRVLASEGWGAWPACSKKLGLR